jgi:hypothetical protein
MKRGRILGVTLAFVGAALFARFAVGDVISYDAGTITNSGDFVVPQWNPAANPDWEYQGYLFTMSLSVSANVTITPVSPPNGQYTIFQPEWNFQIDAGLDNGQYWNAFAGSDTYQVDVGTSSTENIAYSVSPFQEPSDVPVGNVIGTGTDTIPYGLRAFITDSLQNGDMYNSVEVNSMSPVTITGEMTYTYTVVPEPASFSVLLGPALILASRRRRRGGNR